MADRSAAVALPYRSGAQPLPGGTVGTGATRRGGWHGPAHAEPPLCRTGHTEGPGRSRPRPGDPDRHRRSAGRGTTRSRPATYETRVPPARAQFRCTSTSMSNSHLQIGNGLRPPAQSSMSIWSYSMNAAKPSGPNPSGSMIALAVRRPVHGRKSQWGQRRYHST